MLSLPVRASKQPSFAYSLRNITAMTAKPFPIILCGKSREVGQPVMDHLKPEYEGKWK